MTNNRHAQAPIVLTYVVFLSTFSFGMANLNGVCGSDKNNSDDHLLFVARRNLYLLYTSVKQLAII